MGATLEGHQEVLYDCEVSSADYEGIGSLGRGHLLKQLISYEEKLAKLVLQYSLPCTSLRLEELLSSEGRQRLLEVLNLEPKLLSKG